MSPLRPKRTRWREHNCARIADGVARMPDAWRWLAAIAAAVYMQRAFGSRISPEWDLV